MKRALLFLTLLALALACLAVMPMSRVRLLPAVDASAVRGVHAWGYQLQRARPERVSADVDLLVIDYSRDGTHAAAFTREQIAEFRARRQPAGTAAARPRLVLAYMSVGEAESYRYYWSPLWSVRTPSWLGPENKDWKRNYLVKFWSRDWQRVIIAPRPSVLQRASELYMPWCKPYLDRILEAGFDGVYLDRVDAFEAWAAERPSAERDMVAFVKAISAYAKARRPGFLIVPQNGEELLAHPDYRAAIDAVAKEDLLYGLAGDASRNTEDDIKSSIAFLAMARADRLPVFVIEYLRDADQRFEAQLRLREQGFVGLFSTRQLNQPPEPGTPLPALPPETR